LTELKEDSPGILSFEPVASLQGRREQAPFLSHRPLLGFQEVLFVGVEEEHATDRKEHEEYVEREQSEGNT